MIVQYLKGFKFSWSLFLLSWIGITAVSYAEPIKTVNPIWQIDASTKLSLAFASQNNHQPESAFGHVFLVLHRQIQPEPNAQVIEFVGHLESFGDMLATLHDRVDGHYRVLEFSEKALEYDLENRDLYLLELKIEKQNLERLLTKINQQLGQTFPYTFAKYNCAYYLALLLEEQDLMVRRVSTQTYVEPIDLMKSVNEGSTGRASFIPSSHRVLVKHKSALSDAQLSEFERFVRGDDSVLTPQNSQVNQTASAYIRYQLSRESQAWKRQHLAISQKKVWHELPEMTPSPLGEDSNGHYELSRFSGGAIGLKFHPELRNFFSMHTPDQAGAYLDLLSVEAVEKQGRLKLSQLMLFKSESIHPDSHKSRLLDIGYRNWGAKFGRSDQEAYLTFGVGVAFDVKGLSTALIPNLTVAATNAYGHSTNLRWGYRALVEWHGLTWGVRLQTDRWRHSPFAFSGENLIQLRMRLTKALNIGWEFGRASELDRSFQKCLISYAL